VTPLPPPEAKRNDGAATGGRGRATCWASHWFGGNKGGLSLRCPLTRAKTARQKFQRAFAAELLCPFEELQGMLPAAPEDDDVETAARHFEVSPLLVRTSLVNKGTLPRERLSGRVIG
jgi:hypothetical protein